jgi:hypothetical protein
VALVQEVLQPQDQRLVRLEHLVKVILVVVAQDMAAQITLAAEVAVLEQSVVDHLLALMVAQAVQVPQIVLLAPR